VLTERGVDGLLLGRSLAAIRSRHLIGRLRKGCELASPRPYFAPLRAPLTGTATFSGRTPASKLTFLSVRAGAVTSRGIAIGSPGRQALHAYANAHIKNSAPSNPVKFNAIVVKRDGRYRLWFLLDRRGGNVRSFEVPYPQICE